MNNFSNQSTVSLIDLAKIAANPYQPREVEDPLRVAKVAESILTDGLLQPAVGRRRPDGVVQLAFGHTRWAAFRLLDQIAQDPGEVKRDLSETPGLEQLLERSVAGELLPIEKLTWCSLPLMERDLIDEEMFRLAIAENVRRHDLTPIEEAKAMRRYRAEFNKNSADIGSLFGKSDSTVRNIMRLLELPEPIQDQVAKGEISEGSARMLLGAQRAAPQAVLAAAEQMSAQGLDTPAAVGEAIRKEVKKTAFEMCAPWREKAIAGAGLWHFGWTPEELPVLDRIRVNKIFEGLKLEPFSDKTTFERAWWGAATGNVRDMNVQMAVFPEDQRVRAAEALMVLARPPSCNTCPFYTRLEGYHYCGIKACWERKRTAWMDQAAHDLSVKLSIQLYDKARDGSPYEDMQQWDAEAKKFWADKADHLRLVSHYSEYGEYSFTKSSLVKVVSVRKEFQEKAAAEKAQEKEQAKTNESNAKRQEEIQLRYKMIGRYLAAIAVPIMARSLAGLSDGAVEILCQVFYQNWNYGLAEAKKAWNGDYRAVFWGKVMESILPSEVRRDSPLACARHLQGVATAWGKGLELPAEWLELAERFETEVANDGQEKD